MLLPLQSGVVKSSELPPWFSKVENRSAVTPIGTASPPARR